MSQLTPMRSQLIIASTEMLLISDASIPAVDAEFRYYTDDPLAVRLMLSIDQNPAVCWTFGRDLLLIGAQMPSGNGDVQVYPTHDGVIVELHAGDVVAKLLAFGPDLTEFLRRTTTAVPMGSEHLHYDIDAELRGLPLYDTLHEA
ncbi:SsgA family sporulation/cell division regulator [Nakamurella flava]|jgi:hypothetical protein|uniref:SsgA family sporulation/cell division regulator n=1 Tax=Nakamurella flava TaxID=2576308 RepID=A0A4U6QIQ4_9ACTN|nr:SsgA family sporulation/cell division regulator [Nakamurella flava]TKV60297.1 SsgA family sporulation/cell division regulator [Nakamurella flava]